MNPVNLHGYLLIQPGVEQSTFAYLPFFTRNHGKIRLFSSTRCKKYSSLSLLRQPFFFFSIPGEEKNGIFYPRSISVDHSFPAIAHEWDVYRLGMFLLGFQEELLVREDILPSIYWAFFSLCRSFEKKAPLLVKYQLALRFCAFLVVRVGFDTRSIFEIFRSSPEFSFQDIKYLNRIIINKCCIDGLSERFVKELFMKTRNTWEQLFDCSLKSFDIL